MRWLFVVAVAVFTLASIGCAASGQFAVAGRLAGAPGLLRRHADPGGVLGGVPAVPARRQAIATTIAGVFAVLAPTVGPIVGGWITETYSWHWLFLINVAARHRRGRARRSVPAARRALHLAKRARSTACLWS